MRLITAATRYVKEGRRLRTADSRITFISEMRRLHTAHPEHRVSDFTLDELRDHCYSGQGINGGDVAPATIKKRKNLIGPFFGWCHFQGFVKTNPAQHLGRVVDPGRGNGRVREGVWLTVEQVGELYRSFDVSKLIGRRNRLIFVLGVMTGLRNIEIGQGLRWSDFTSDFTMFTVNGKGNKTETRPVSPLLRVELAAWRAEAPADAEYVLPSMSTCFSFETGAVEQPVRWDKPLGRAGIYDVIKALSADYGVKFRPHDLRRSFAGILQAQDVPLDQIQDLMRHTSIATTAAYLSRNPARLESTVEGIKWAM